MKKLDKFILGSFLGPFFLTFLVVVFIFLTQYLLKYLEDMVGKDLGIEVYSELIFYFSINMVPVSLPLAILLSCLITFGNLGEHFELTAIKSSGISLIRVLAPIAVMVVGMSFGSFYFNNTIVPKANLKAFSLLYDIRQKKPSLDFKEGSFYKGLPGYSIKIKEKDEDGKTIKGVMIYDHTRNSGNTEVILADSGQMYSFNNEQYLALELFNGVSYTEHINDGSTILPKEFIRNRFERSKLVFSLESFGLNRTPEELFSTNKVMKNVKVLQVDIDSMRRESNVIRHSMPETVQPFYTYKVANDSIRALPAVPTEISFQDVSHNMVYNRAVNHARSVKAYLASNLERVQFLEKEARIYEAEKHRKYSQAVACIMMFLIGAPLGAIIKKGGFGVPVIISICFFILFYVVSMIGEKHAKEGVVSMEWGMWVGNLVLFPIGLFFLRQARSDSRILDADVYLVFFSKVKKMFLKKAKDS